MRPRPALLLAAALAAGCGKGSPTPAGEAPGPLDGTYDLVGIERNGMRFTEDQLRTMRAKAKADYRIEIKADRITAYMGERSETSTVVLDPAKSPPTIDITEKRPDDKLVTNYGIYKLEGDTLTLCASDGGTPADRPAEFKPGPKRVVTTLKKR